MCVCVYVGVRNKLCVCLWVYFVCSAPSFDLQLCVCVYKSVYASLNMHYLPHYSWSPNTANGNSSPSALTRCGCECMHTSMCVSVCIGNNQCIRQ